MIEVLIDAPRTAVWTVNGYNFGPGPVSRLHGLDLIKRSLAIDKRGEVY